jgi:hypothetical protein
LKDVAVNQLVYVKEGEGIVRKVSFTNEKDRAPKK